MTRKKKLPTKAELSDLKARTPDANLVVRAADATIVGSPARSWPPAKELLSNPGVVAAGCAGATAFFEATTRPEFSPGSIAAWTALAITFIAACVKGYFVWKSDTQKLVVTPPEEKAA